MDLRILPGRGELPVAIDIAATIDRAFRAGLPKRISASSPFRKKSFARFNEHGGRRVGGNAAEHASHRESHVALELGLRDARRLKIFPVKVRDAVWSQSFERAARPVVRWSAQSRAYRVPRRESQPEPDFRSDVARNRTVPASRDKAAPKDLGPARVEKARCHWPGESVLKAIAFPPCLEGVVGRNDRSVWRLQQSASHKARVVCASPSC